MTMGVYAIRNTVNGMQYVGGSQNIEQRWRGHRNLLNCKKHVNPRLQMDWEEFGASAFEFVVLERVGSIPEITNAETKFLDDPGMLYNMRRTPTMSYEGQRGGRESLQVYVPYRLSEQIDALIGSDGEKRNEWVLDAIRERLERHRATRG